VVTAKPHGYVARSSRGVLGSKATMAILAKRASILTYNMWLMKRRRQ
jgi:hypothetical protein